MQDAQHRTHIDIAAEYFSYLARRFPVMCASDEFHFLPRAEEAAQYFDKLDDLDEDAILQDLKGSREIFQPFAVTVMAWRHKSISTCCLRISTASSLNSSSIAPGSTIRFST